MWHGVEPVPGFDEFGITAFTTTRQQGSFALGSAESSEDVWRRWTGVAELIQLKSRRLAFAHQVHGDLVVQHNGPWEGILRHPGADGHYSVDVATGMAVTLADCVPVFLAHPAGVGGVLHSGWKGTASRIVQKAIGALGRAGFPADELLVHCGPSICGSCYEVSAEVYQAVTQRPASGKVLLDLRSQILSDARALGVERVSASHWCTRCHNERFYSHRCGDTGRQLGVLVTRSQLSLPSLP